ncbi:MAG TPA: hypothetical protein PKJ79_03810 [Quisquiliibacterium sp.]|nr:hypothetical protein [Quisquiliibacterium sp.]
MPRSARFRRAERPWISPAAARGGDAGHADAEQCQREGLGHLCFAGQRRHAQAVVGLAGARAEQQGVHGHVTVDRHRAARHGAAVVVGERAQRGQRGQRRQRVRRQVADVGVEVAAEDGHRNAGDADGHRVHRRREAEQQEVVLPEIVGRFADAERAAADVADAQTRPVLLHGRLHEGAGIGQSPAGDRQRHAAVRLHVAVGVARSDERAVGRGEVEADGGGACGEGGGEGAGDQRGGGEGLDLGHGVALSWSRAGVGILIFENVMR